MRNVMRKNSLTERRTRYMKDKGNKYRMAIQFNIEEEKQRQALNFLGRCGRRKNKIIAIAIVELMEKYKLTIEDMDKKELTNFLNAYSYMRNSMSNNMETEHRPLKTKAPKKESTEITDEDKDKANNKKNKALAAFGVE